METLRFILLLSTFVGWLTMNGQSVFINELMPDNRRIIDEAGEQEDWIELYNAESAPVNLLGWSLTDDPDEPDKYVFTSDFYLPAGGFRILWADKDAGFGHLPFKLSAEGETLSLFRPSADGWIVEDSVNFPALAANISYGRTQDGATAWQRNSITTPAASNQDNRPYSPALPVFSLPAGIHPGGTVLTLHSNLPAAQIRYTTDGSYPDADSPFYTEPLTLDTTVLITAAVLTAEGSWGLPVGRFYLTGKEHTLPVLQIQTEQANLWDHHRGIYAKGTNGVGNVCSSAPRNWNQPWRRPAALTFYETDGSIGFAKKAEIKIAGGCSRGLRMKSFNVFLEDGDNLDYPLFPQLPHRNYRRFKLRNSGADFAHTMLRDGAIQEILRGRVDLDLQAYRPVVLYLNGRYFGIYNLREFYNEDYINQYYGERETDMIRNPWMYYQEVKEGDAEACNALNDWVAEHNLTTPENYDYFREKVDLNQMINYWLSELYTANFDWPDNNMMMWNDRNDPAARWRFMLYDLDVSTGYNQQWAGAEYNSLRHALAPNSNSWPNRPPSTLWLRKLTQNLEFLHEFAQRHLSFGQLIFSPARVRHFTDSLVNDIRPEMSNHSEFWNSTPDSWATDLRPTVGGSTEVWEERLWFFTDFFDNRLPQVIGQYASEFDFAGTYELHLNFTSESGGRVVLHRNKMPAPFDYKGQYFRNIPLRLEAVPDPGFVFVKWEETDYPHPVLDFLADQNQTLTPLFVRAEDILTTDADLQLNVFPNPATDVLTFRVASGQPVFARATIINVFGQWLLQRDLTLDNIPSEHDFNLSDFAPGIYFLQLQTGNDKRIEKFMIR